MHPKRPLPHFDFRLRGRLPLLLRSHLRPSPEDALRESAMKKVLEAEEGVIRPLTEVLRKKPPLPRTMTLPRGRFAPVPTR